MFSRDTLLLKFSNYSKYHQNIYNLIVRFITIPIIIYTLMCILSHFQIKIFNDNYGGNVISIHGGIIIVIMSLIYPFVDVPSGILLFVFMIIAYLCSNLFYFYVPLGYITKLGIVSGIHVISWMIQIMGHYVFEKNVPLFGNCRQAFVDAIFVAPIFVCLEIMFLCGYNKSLRREIEIRHLTEVHVDTEQTAYYAFEQRS